MSEEVPIAIPVGSDVIARWAQSRQLSYRTRPEQSWFRKWEPFDTMVIPTCYFNACTWNRPPGQVVIAEPWTEVGVEEPMDRTIMAFASHPGLRWRASMRSSETFITRVTFLVDLPMPEVKLGDPVWDDNVKTHALSTHDAAGAFHPRFREQLRQWGFRGHLELRAGGMVVHVAGLQPIPEHYDQLLQLVPQMVVAALG